MLFQKHRGENNQKCQRKGSDAETLVILQHLAVIDCQGSGEGIVYVDTRKNIGGSIHLIQPGDHPAEDVVIRKRCGTDIQPVRIDRGDDQENGHPREQIEEEAVIFRYIPVDCGEKSEHKEHEYKPGKVEHNKIFNKRNIPVERAVDQMIASRIPDGFLKITKYKKIEDRIGGKNPELFSGSEKRRYRCQHKKSSLIIIQGMNPGSSFIDFTLNFNIQFQPAEIFQK